MSTSHMVPGVSGHSSPSATGEQGEPGLEPLTPRSRGSAQRESSLGAAFSTPRANDTIADCSPERTPGPGEGSPVGMDTQGECEEEYSVEVDSIVADVEERSSRRAAAIRGVLAQLRPAKQSADTGYPGPPAELPPLPSATVGANEPSRARRTSAILEEADEVVHDDEPLPQPRAHPPPAPVPMPFSGGLGRQAVGDGEQEWIGGHGAAQALPAPPKSAVLMQRKLVQHCDELEEQLEQHQKTLDSTMGSLENERLAAQEAHDALSKVEAEVAYAENMAARKDAELRMELLNTRADHKREVDRMRAESRRMQTSLKDLQSRVKSEAHGRQVAIEQVECLKEQLAAARSDVQRRGKEGHDAKSAFQTLEKRLEQYTELFKWVSARCTETLGEDAVHELRNGSSHGMDTIDGLKRVIGRTFTVLQRRSASDSDGEKENMANKARALRTKKKTVAAETTQRLAVVQAELLNYEVQNEELISRQRCLQERLAESENAASESKGGTSGLRTETRGRLRAAEDGQKRMKQQVTQLQEELQWQYTRHEEDHEGMRKKLSALQRAKEAGERYIESEEDAWINAQRQERALHSEYSSLRAEIHDAEANAREACTDAVEARAASQVAETTKRRLEADLEEMHATASSFQSTTASLPGTARSVSQDSSVALAAQALLESELQNARSEIEVLRDEMSASRTRSQDLQQETKSFKQRITAEEHHAGEWHMAADSAQKDLTELRKALEEQVQASQYMEWQFKAAMENQQAKQAKIDEAKRVMVTSAMEQQEQTLRNEMSCVEATFHARYEEAVRDYADKHQEHMLQLDHANKSVAFFQHQATAYEAELHQQTHDLGLQEQRICDFGRAELTAMTAQQEAKMQAHIDAKTEGLVEDAVTSARKQHREELAQLRSREAADIAAVHEEYSGQLAAMRNSELSSRNELAASRLACEAVEAAGEDEAEKSRTEAVALRVRGEKLHMELRKELWTDSYTKARLDVLEEVRSNPGSKLRRELWKDMRHELTDQLRAEIRSEMSSQMYSTSGSSYANGTPPRVTGSPASSSSRPRSALYSRKANVSGASPSSIGACSTVGSSPACATSALMLPPESSSSWADGFEQPFKDEDISAAFGEAEVIWDASKDDPALGRRPGVTSAPPSRQSSTGLREFAEQGRQTGVFRQRTDPLGSASYTSSRLDGALPPAPQNPSSGPEHTTFSALPPPPGSWQKPAAPKAAPTTSFQEQASAVLEMVSRSRAPFKSSGFARQGREADRSFGLLPPWPGHP